MLLVQRVIDGNADLSFKIIGKPFPNMKALEREMKKHSQNFNEGFEYSLIEPLRLLKVTYTQKAKVESRNILEKDT